MDHNPQFRSNVRVGWLIAVVLGVLAGIYIPSCDMDNTPEAAQFTVPGVKAIQREEEARRARDAADEAVRLARTECAQPGFVLATGKIVGSLGFYEIGGLRLGTRSLTPADMRLSTESRMQDYEVVLRPVVKSKNTPH